MAENIDPAAPDARLAARHRRQHQRERHAEQLLGIEGDGTPVPVRAELPSPPTTDARPSKKYTLLLVCSGRD